MLNVTLSSLKHILYVFNLVSVIHVIVNWQLSKKGIYLLEFENVTTRFSPSSARLQASVVSKHWGGLILACILVGIAE